MKNNKLLIFITDIEVIERISSIIMEFLLFLINFKSKNNSKWTNFFQYSSDFDDWLYNL